MYISTQMSHSKSGLDTILSHNHACVNLQLYKTNRLQPVCCPQAYYLFLSISIHSPTPLSTLTHTMMTDWPNDVSQI